MTGTTEAPNSLRADDWADATPAQTTAFVTSATSVGDAIKSASAEAKARAVEELAQLYGRYHVPGEGVMIGTKAWLVTAIA